MDGQLAAVAQRAQAGARHLDGITLGVDENERIEVRLLVEQTPDVRFKLERFVLQAVVLWIVMAKNLTTRRAALPWKARAVAAADPAPVRMEEAILAVDLVALGQRKARHDARAWRLWRGARSGRNLRFD